MERDAIKQYADWLQTNTDDIIAQHVKFDPNKVYEIIDQLKIFKKPVTEIMAMTEEDYYQQLSDHKLTLQGERDVLTHLQDRVLINHVDGSITQRQIHFSYNHEDNFAGGYSARKDLHLLTYGLKVIGAVVVISDFELVQENISADAAVSLALAADMISRWQDEQ
ncbi:hypothetical protein [Lapidilactobacillus wuchangensis]|uniref:hypothetical protein n=1 Tax=Lapidilactobacillus wuchangensis TaxID=2486001 RepID=UPI000F78D133|nr:hypothetical protein [Lapidilactobacillus wuchangensis]